ncbi:transposase [[Leptolyngbya] sp. PCC 7376]|uniref:transposase n=1 Tax=[Leptolyngbya] sp. PCC 7376 TaxID=111781 RepID=UPI0013580C2D|nr:transposase [[Leptolyngbya] sp. PCC 7376]
MIVIDEMGVHLALTRSHARATRGQRARGTIPTKTERNVTVIGALSLKGMLVRRFIYGNTDGSTFEGFILKNLVPQLWEGACVVMDNARIHGREMIRYFLVSKKARLIYLPSYSPDFSLIENCWSKLKNGLKGDKPCTYLQLLEDFDFNLKQVTPAHIKHWFTHCCYCL